MVNNLLLVNMMMRREWTVEASELRMPVDFERRAQERLYAWRCETEPRLVPYNEGVLIRKDRVTDRSIVLSCGRPALRVVVEDGMREPNSVPIELWRVWYGEVVRSILCMCANRYSRVAGASLVSALEYCMEPGSPWTARLRIDELVLILLPWLDPGGVEVAQAVRLMAAGGYRIPFARLKGFFRGALPRPMPAEEWLISIVPSKDRWWFGREACRLVVAPPSAWSRSAGVKVVQACMRSWAFLVDDVEEACLPPVTMVRQLLRGTRVALEAEARQLLANCVAEYSGIRSQPPITFLYAIAIYTDQVRRARRLLGGTRRRAVAQLGRRYGLPHDVQRMVWRAVVRPDWALLRAAQSRACMARVDDDDDE